METFSALILMLVLAPILVLSLWAWLTATAAIEELDPEDWGQPGGDPVIVMRAPPQRRQDDDGTAPPLDQRLDPHSPSSS